MANQFVNMKPGEKPLVALVACPYDNRDYINREDIAFDDLSLGYLFAVMQKQGYPVVLFDSLRFPFIFGSLYDRLTQQIQDTQPSYVVFSDPLLTFGRSLKLSQALKTELPDLTIIYCGLHASLYCEDILNNEFQVDYVICGDSEYTLPILIATLENSDDLVGIPGLAWRNQGGVKVSPPDYSFDLDRLPFPHRPSLRVLKSDRHSLFNILSSRGCPGHCTYCVTSAFLNRCCPNSGQRWRFRSSQDVFAELQNLYAQGVRRFFFTDDNWIGTRDVGLERAMKICRLIIDNRLTDISFNALVRPDSLLPTDTDVLLLMKEAGLTGLSIGLESAHSDQLKLFGKKVDLDRVKELIGWLRSNHIFVRCGFIMFYPYSTFDMLRVNSRYLDEIGLSYMFTAYYSSLRALSALPIEKRLRQDNLVLRPTTYKSAGEYQYLDKRIEALQLFLASTMVAERETIYIMLTAGTEASKQSKSKCNFWDSIMESLNCVGKASADLFTFCLDTFENCSDTVEAAGTSYLYAQSWSKVLKMERVRMENLL